jgi:RimJ/RimL family protein N-acetyltransferase
MDITFIPADPNLAALFQTHREDPVTRKFNPLQPSTIESTKTFLEKTCSNWSDFEKPNTYSFFWFVKYGDDIVGNTNINNINKMMMTAEIGYGVFAKFRGKGIATKIVTAITKNTFGHTPLRKLSAFVHEDNAASLRVLEKVGYKKEGLLREAYLIIGMPANEFVLGILRREI